MERAGKRQTCVFREMIHDDVDALVSRLSREGVYIAQIKSDYFARLFFRRQRSDSRLNIFLALDENAIVGWTIAIQDSRNFWKAFIVHHPFWGTRIIFRKIMSYCHSTGILRKREQLDLMPSPSAPFGNRTVFQARETAAHVDITVLSQYRKCGVASKLQELQLKDLKFKGARHITATIAEWNSRSVSFHQKHGWVFHSIKGGNWEISKDL